MRQRAMIAMALLFTPQLVVMDEPTSALDVVAQRSLMTKIRELQEQLGFAVIFVTHDMHVVSRYSDRVLVMYAGQMVEAAPTEQIFAHPLHPYSRGLIEAFPCVTGPRRELVGIPGSPPDLADPPQRLSLPATLPGGDAELRRRRARALRGRASAGPMPALRGRQRGRASAARSRAHGRSADAEARADRAPARADPCCARSA